MNTWQSYLLRKSACLSSIHGVVGSEMADRYYRETVKGIDIAAGNLQEVQEILEEISDEIWCDLELKEAALRSRELIVICLVIIQKMVNDPHSLTNEKFIGAKYASLSFGRSDSEDRLRSDSIAQPRRESGTASRVKLTSLTPTADRFTARIEVARQLFTDAVRRTSQIGAAEELGISREERSLLMQPIVLKRLSLIRTALKVHLIK